jgi:tetratricopeptide (TPR) repeat protein
MRASRRLRCISVALSIALASPPVLADAGEPATSALETYRDIVQRGTSAFVARRFAEARAAFERAFEIHPDPVLVFNIASCWRRDGNTAEALAEYRRFLTIAPSDDARRMLAEETIAQLEAERISPPSATLAVSESPPPPAPRSIWRPIGLTTTGIGAIGLTVGIVELVRARNDNDSNDWDGNNDGSNNDGGGGWDGSRDTWNHNGGDNDWNNADEERERAKRRAYIIGGASTAVMTAGVIMYLIGRRAERPVRVTPAVTSDGAQLVFGGRF